MTEYFYTTSGCDGCDKYEVCFLVHFSPAAIDLENRDLASLVVPKLRFAQMATIKEDEIKYKLVIKVSEKRGVLQLGY